MSKTTIQIPRESDNEFVRVDITTLADGLPALYPVEFAVLKRGKRPTEDDWSPSDADPTGSGYIGIIIDAVPREEFYGVWARIFPDDMTSLVLEPREVGWIHRT